jgi:hypothetical protein
MKVGVWVSCRRRSCLSFERSRHGDTGVVLSVQALARSGPGVFGSLFWSVRRHRVRRFAGLVVALGLLLSVMVIVRSPGPTSSPWLRLSLARYR